MNKQSLQTSFITNALEHGLLEQELRGIAQRAAVEAMARGIRRVFSKLRAWALSGRETTTSGFRSA